ncbi:ABC transporter substrate-binding protein [Azospirillum endophyticum]|nr:ABC transporter substrate-binding protein [Azospirillum endophyticum]
MLERYQALLHKGFDILYIGRWVLGRYRNAATEQLQADYRNRRQQGRYRIIDVMVEGISMGITQRREFGSAIQQNGGKVDGLRQALRQKLG